MGKRNFIFLAILIFLSGCSSVRRMGLGMASPMFYEATNGLMAENNWQNFQSSVLGNIKLVEGLHSIDPENEDLLVTLIKGYAGYAYMVNETNYLYDKLKENEKDFHKRLALANYTKAIEYGTQFLKLNDIEFSQLQKAMRDEGGIAKILEGELNHDQETLEAAFYTAHALAGLINLQRDKMLVVAQLPLAKGIFDWVCGIDPNINNGICPVFYAGYEAGRPKMLGGNPEKGKKLFLEMIKKDPTNLLARVSFLEYYVIPMSDEDLYREQADYLEEALEKQAEELVWKPGKKKDPLFSDPTRGLYQAGALEKFKTIKKLEKEIF